MKATVLLIALSGCANLPGTTYWTTNRDQQAIDMLLEETGGSQQCDEERGLVRIAITTTQEFTELCAGFCAPGRCPGRRASVDCPWGCASECYVKRRFGGPLSSPVPLVVIHESVVPSEELGQANAHVVHGLAHWAMGCSFGDTDSQHEHTIWERIGE